MTSFSLKAGTTFSPTGQILEDDGITPVSLVGATLTSQIRDENKKLIATLDITITNAAQGAYAITVPGGTHAWPEDRTLRWDIKSIKNSAIQFTKTIFFYVERSETRT